MALAHRRRAAAQALREGVGCTARPWHAPFDSVLARTTVPFEPSLPSSVSLAGESKVLLFVEAKVSSTKSAIGNDPLTSRPLSSLFVSFFRAYGGDSP